MIFRTNYFFKRGIRIGVYQKKKRGIRIGGKYYFVTQIFNTIFSLTLKDSNVRLFSKELQETVYVFQHQTKYT